MRLMRPRRLGTRSKPLTPGVVAMSRSKAATWSGWMSMKK